MPEPASASSDHLPGRRRSAARLAAVQAIYEMDVAGASADPVLGEFMTRRWHGRDDEAADAMLAEPDPALLADLVRGVGGRVAELDALIEPTLSGEWTLARLEAVLRCILRAGAYELLARPDVPAKVVISEYLDVAHAFFDGSEPRMVNGVLDTLARRLRPSDLGEAVNDQAEAD